MSLGCQWHVQGRYGYTAAAAVAVGGAGSGSWQLLQQMAHGESRSFQHREYGLHCEVLAHLLRQVLWLAL